MKILHIKIIIIKDYLICKRKVRTWNYVNKALADLSVAIYSHLLLIKHFIMLFYLHALTSDAMPIFASDTDFLSINWLNAAIAAKYKYIFAILRANRLQ